MSIYTILQTLSTNQHYLDRYFRFLKGCQGGKIKHHILPRSLAPDHAKDPENIALLTDRQHYIAHWMLWKACPKENKMATAFLLMNRTGHSKISSRTYQELREAQAKRVSEVNKGNTYRLGKTNKRPRKTKPKPPSIRTGLSMDNWSGEGNPMYGMKRPDKWKRQHSEDMKKAYADGRYLKICPECGRQMNAGPLALHLRKTHGITRRNHQERQSWA